jgi:putative membrane protein (TIGR04086 family)
MAMSDRWDLDALKAGASVTVVFAAPFLVAARLLAIHDEDSPYILPLVLIAIVGFVLGAGVAAWRQDRRTPLSHGIVTSAGTFLVVQAIFVVINLIRGADINWFTIVFTLTVTVFAGALGGLLAVSLQKRGLEPKK